MTLGRAYINFWRSQLYHTFNQTSLWVTLEYFVFELQHYIIVRSNHIKNIHTVT